MTVRLSVDDVAWYAGTTCILKHVRFEVGPGEFVALMGRNGAGKSTLLDLVAGLRRPSEGRVMLDGRALSEWSPAHRARTVSHLPQTVRADVGFSGEELVLMGRYPHAQSWSDSALDRDIVERAMRRCGCLEFRRRKVSSLSGGERQRVLLAACLAQEPQLLLLDEPATFLDVEQQLQCFELLREETERGAACIAVTHDVNLALTFCTRLLILADHTVVRDLAVRESISSPEWLSLFSPRLSLTRTPAGRPWVWYQGSGIRDQGSGIGDQGSGIGDQGSGIGDT